MYRKASPGSTYLEVIQNASKHAMHRSMATAKHSPRTDVQGLVQSEAERDTAARRKPHKRGGEAKEADQSVAECRDEGADVGSDDGGD